MNIHETRTRRLQDTTPIMPTDPEAVELLLGAILYTSSSRALQYIADIRPEYFYPKETPALICFQNITEEPPALSPELLYDRLQKKNVPIEVLGYASKLSDCEKWKVDDEGYIESLIARVRQSWQLRTIQEEVSRVSKEIDAGKRRPEEIIRAHKERFESIARTTEPGFLGTVSMSDVQPQETEWLAYPYLPIGKVTMLEGDPGIGKSHVSLAFAAGVAAGSGLPGQKERREPRAVLIASVEDGLADTIRPRLDRMSAHVERIYAVAEPFSFDDKGLLLFEAAISELQAALVIVDPIQGYFGSGVDIHRTNETRPILARLAEIAERQRCSILCIRHLTKTNGGKAIYRGIGSIDFSAAVRSILLAGCDPDNPSKRAVVQTKNNLAVFGEPIGYEINAEGFYWTGKSDLTDITILGARSGDENGEERSAIEDATEFLISCLENGPLEPAVLKEQAALAGIAWATVRRAKDQLRIKSRKMGGHFGGDQTWRWELPQEPEHAQPPEHAHTKLDEHLQQTHTNNSYKVSKLAEHAHSRENEHLQRDDEHLQQPTEHAQEPLNMLTEHAHSIKVEHLQLDSSKHTPYRNGFAEHAHSGTCEHLQHDEHLQDDEETWEGSEEANT